MKTLFAARNSRGWIYFAVAFLTPVAERCNEWSQQGRGWNDLWNLEIVSVALGSTVAGLIAVRAYMDQHLSRAN